MNAGSWGITLPGSLNHDFIILVEGWFHAFGDGLEHVLSTYKCSLLWWTLGGSATQHGSAVLVIHSVVLAGEGEEQLAARTIIAASMEKTGAFPENFIPLGEATYVPKETI